MVIGKVENKVVLEKVMQIIKSQLSEREYQIIAMRYGLEGRQPMTQKEVAKVFKISRSYVSRIETKVLEKLKKHMMKEKIFL